VAKFLHWLAKPNTTLLLYQGLGHPNTKWQLLKKILIKTERTFGNRDIN
jgi:hypothetical protein